ncbi:MAG: hypothetical protein HY590_01960 [Candidatus Omnitrophica bacterium]|nr:hypothetical protein [Candidatus Omnitrophota bacterium]
MYYIVKFIQAAGLSIILIGFLQKFPALMSPKVFLLGVGIFMLGWLINRYS